jgi:hypothetical protein
MCAVGGGLVSTCAPEDKPYYRELELIKLVTSFTGLLYIYIVGNYPDHLSFTENCVFSFWCIAMLH